MSTELPDGQTLNSPEPAAQLFRRFFAAVAAYKLLLVAFPFFAVNFLPPLFYVDQYKANFISPAAAGGVWALLETWDAQHYMHLSKYGYEPGKSSNTFWPLFPAAMALLQGVTGMSPLAGGLIVSNVCSFAGLWVFYRYVERKFSARLAESSTLFLLAFPTAFYLSLVYSESLFLLLAFTFFHALEREKSSVATAVAFLLPLARPTGVFIAVPFLVWLIIRRRWQLRWVMPLVAIGAGLAVYFGVLEMTTGNAFEAFRIQRNFVAQGSLAKIVDVAGMVETLLTPAPLRNFTGSLFDRIWFLLYLGSLYLVWRLDRVLFAYAAVIGLVPAASLSFMSFSRHVLLAFPMFIAWAWAIRNRAWRTLALAVMFAMQILAYVVHANNHWFA